MRQAEPVRQAWNYGKLVQAKWEYLREKPSCCFGEKLFGHSLKLY